MPPHRMLGRAGRLWALALLVVAGLVGVALKMPWSEAVYSMAALREVVTGGMSGLAVGVLLYAMTVLRSTNA